MNMLSTDQEGDKWVEFKDDQISCLNLETPDDLSHLIVNCLCGESDVVSLEKEEIELLSDLIKNARTEKKINYNQLNELLLLFNQDTIGKDFFVFFFGEMDISLMDLKKGVINFQGFAMLIFGNLKYAYKTLGNKSKTKIESELFPYCRASLEIIREFKKRPNKMLEITKIPKLKTWLAGEVSAGKIESEITLLKKVMEDCPTLQFNNYKLNDFAEWLIKIEKEGKEVQEIARKNTDIYLTWDYMDLYFATSMRVNSEFEETFEFITRVLNDERLKRLSLRYFDPTQSKCGNHIDKGMIEGLMLKRAVCTIYMVQESDTFGKDSELAATLAQKKPVIAYVPKPIVEDYAEKISNSPLDFIRRRILILQAEDVFTEKSCYQSLFEYRKDFRQIIGRLFS